MTLADDVHLHALDAEGLALLHVGKPDGLRQYFRSFGLDRDRVLQQTLSGGVTINDTLLHVAQDNLPFGGVGPSGMGAYHGQAGFDLFSKLRPVFSQSRFAGTRLLQPPYGTLAERVIGLLKRLV